MPIPAWIVLSAACATLILWAKVWNERQRHHADGEVRETLQLPRLWDRCGGLPLPQLNTFSPLYVPPLFLAILLSLNPLNSFSRFWISPFGLIFPGFLLCILFTFCSFIHLSLSFSSPTLPSVSPEGNLISPSSWPVHNSPSLHGW